MTDENTLRANCDTGIATLARMLLESGASPGLLIDRLLTFSAAHAVAWTGTAETAAGMAAACYDFQSGGQVRITDRHAKAAPRRGFEALLRPGGASRKL